MGRNIRVLLACLCLFAIGLPPAAWGAEPAVERSESVGGAESHHDPNYLIGKGDVLEVNVWREPMLSGEVAVRTDGKISVTLLGDVQAAGKTTEQLKHEIQAGLKQYVGEPAVTVIVRTPHSQRYYVMGEVRNPGEFELVKDMTIVQAIARAGGFNEWASKSEVLLLRREGGVEKRIPINYKDIVKGKSIQQNIMLRANDTIVVP